MPDLWHVVYRVATGEAYSIGTSLADPMPAEFASVLLSESDAAALNNGGGRWDAESLSVVPV
jgi:hypothetical protein